MTFHKGQDVGKGNRLVQTLAGCGKNGEQSDNSTLLAAGRYIRLSSYELLTFREVSFLGITKLAQVIFRVDENRWLAE